MLTSGRYVKSGLSLDAVGPASYTYRTKTGTSIAVEIPGGELLTGESTCSGASGGPLLDAAGDVIGVTSRGIDDTCLDRPTIFSATASHAQLIADAATTTGHPLHVSSDAPPTTAVGGSTSNGSSDDGTSGTSATSTRRSSGAVGQANAGCSVPRSHGHLTSSATAFALGLAIAALRRRRSRRPSRPCR